jgi:Sec63 Brl domain
LNKDVKIKVEGDPEDPHFKANLLVQSYLLHLQLPISDYNTDLKSVLDQCIRILQAMMDVSAEKAMLGTTLAIQSVLQNMIQARWLDSDPLWQLPFMSENLYWAISKDFASDLPTLVVKAKEQPDKLRQILKRAISDKDAEVVRLNCFILNCFHKITHLS